MYPQPQQQKRVNGVRRHLTAYACMDTVGICDFDHIADKLQYRRICRAVKIRHLFVSAIDRHGVLHKVIGSDTEKIYQTCQMFGLQCGDRSLNHHTERQIGHKFFIFRSKLLLKNVDYLTSLQQIGRAHV